jgi:hypothetical protein
MNEATPTRPHSRRMLILLAALFLIPLAVSFYLYYASGWRPGGQVNHGELITPPRALPAVSLATPSGENTASEFLHDKWSLLYIGAGACDQHCRAALYTIRQVRLALGDKMERVQRVFLYTGGCCEQPFFGVEHAGLIAASVDSASGAELLHEFPDERATSTTGRIYLVDPLGNLMMQYPPQALAKGMIEDLKRLLKLSHIG